jgi:hypothetical protein
LGESLIEIYNKKGLGIIQALYRAIKIILPVKCHSEVVSESLTLRTCNIFI